MNLRIMRILVFFDLPTGTKTERKRHSQFRKFLKTTGFEMLQWSVYVRITRNHDDMEKIIKIVMKNIPPRGDIRCLTVTEQQYSNIRILLGDMSPVPEYTTKELIEF